MGKLWERRLALFFGGSILLNVVIFGWLAFAEYTNLVNQIGAANARTANVLSAVVQSGFAKVESEDGSQVRLLTVGEVCSSTANTVAE